MSHTYILYINIFSIFPFYSLYFYKNFFTCKYMCDIVSFVTFVYFLYNYAKTAKILVNLHCLNGKCDSDNIFWKK